MGLPVSVADVNLIAPDATLHVSRDSVTPSYSCCTGLFTPPANPTDVVALLPAGSQMPQIQLRRVTVSGVSTSGGQLQVRLIFGANGGTNGIATHTSYPRDKYDGAASAGVWRFTSNRTSGSAPVFASDNRTIIDEADLVLGVAGSTQGAPAVFNFPSGAKTPTIKQAYDWITVGFGGQTLPAGTQIRVTLEWNETPAVRVGFLGDSTTSNATPDLLNNSTNSGGIGKTGATNIAATVDNLGSNGFRIFDFINGTNGVTVPMSQVASYLYDVLPICYGINDCRKGDLGADIASCTNRLTAMIDTAVQGLLYGTTNGGNYTSPKATKYTISAASWASNTVTLTTSTPHGYALAESIRLEVAGMTPAAYNGVFSCTFPAANQIRYTLASDPGAATVMGVVAFTTQWSFTSSGNPDVKIILWSPNCICTDDLGDTPGYGGLSASGAANPTAMTGIWTGLTMAQAAQALTDILYNAYQPFVGDSRVFAVLNKQDVLGRTAKPIAQMTVRGYPFMVNQIHPGTWGRKITLRQIMPVLRSAIQAVRAIKF